MFTPKRPNKFFYILTLVVFLAQLALPTAARAEGETPPADPAATEIAPVDPAAPEAAPADPTEVAPEPAATETPTPEPVIDLSAVPDGTDVVVLDENGQPLPLGSQAAADVVAQGDPIWCPGSQNPYTNGGNSTGCSPSYLTLTALLTALDESTWPDGTIWIEKGIYDGLAGHNTAEAGTQQAGSGPFMIRLNGSSNTNSLTIQGGWNSSTGAIDGTSNYVLPLNFQWSGNLTIKNITYDGTSDSSNPDYGLIIGATGTGKTLTLDHVQVLSAHNTNGLAQGTNIAGTDTDSVIITDSKFNLNQGSGLRLYDFGNFTLTRVDASNNNSDNGGYGASITCHTSGTTDLCDTGTVKIEDSTFNGNGSVVKPTDAQGLYVNTDGTISISGVTANGNTGTGARIQNDYGTKPLTISDSTFGTTKLLSALTYPPAAADRALAGNGGEGLLVYSKGALTLNSVIADYNRANGLSGGVGGSGTLTIGKTGPSSPASSFSHNGMDGIKTESAGGAVTLNSVLATDNGQHGAELGGATETGNYTITGGTFSNNGGQTYHTNDYAYDGLNVKTSGNIAVSSVTASGNARNGASLDTVYGSKTGTVTVTNSTFGSAPSIFSDPTGNKDADPRKWGNGGMGLEIKSGGATSLNTVTANYNGSAWLAKNFGPGVAVTTDAAISLNTVTANYNYESGLKFSGAAPSVTLNTVTAHDNGLTSSPKSPGLSGSDLTASSLAVICTSNSITNNGAADTITCTSSGGSGSPGGGELGGSGSGGGETPPSGGDDWENDPAFPEDHGAFIKNVEVSGGESVDLSCGGGTGGYNLDLAGNQVSLPCGSLSGDGEGTSASLSLQPGAQLPAAVDRQFSYVTALEVKLSAPLKGDMLVSFALPAGAKASSFSILFWDGSKWIDLGGFESGNGLFNVKTTQGGIYVLVSK